MSQFNYFFIILQIHEQKGLAKSGNKLSSESFFDTVKVMPASGLSVAELRKRAEAKGINLRYFADGQHVGISLDETVKESDVDDLLQIFGSKQTLVCFLRLHRSMSMLT